MKILHALGWYFPDSIGGTEIYVSTLTSLQLASGHDVAVCAPKTGARGVETYRHRDHSVYRYPIPVSANRAQVQHRVPSHDEVCFNELLDHGWDLFHMHSVTTGLNHFNLEACRQRGIPTVVTNHLPALGYLCQRGTLLRWGSSPCDGHVEPRKCAACELQHRGVPRSLASPLAWTTQWVRQDGYVPRGRLGSLIGMPDLIRSNIGNQQRLMRSADRFVVLNDSAFQKIVANGAPRDKLVVNRLGVRNSFSTNLRHERRDAALPLRFGFVGRITATKGLSTIVRAVERLGSHLDFTVEVMGPVRSPADSELLRALERLTVRDERVRLRDTAEGDLLADYLASLDVLLVPSLWFENGPTVLLEAHAVGTPAIVSGFGAMPEVVADGVNGAVIPPGDWAALASTITALCEEPKTVDRWRERLSAVRTMEDVASDYESLYADAAIASAGASCGGLP